MTALVAIGAVVLLLLCLLVAGLLRSHLSILRRLHELGIPAEDVLGPERPNGAGKTRARAAPTPERPSGAGSTGARPSRDRGARTAKP